MTVRPVDMLTMLPRLHEAARQQHESVQQREANQATQATQAPVKAAREQQQVRSKESAEHAAVRDESGGKQGSGEQERKQGRREPAKEGAREPADEQGAGHLLDVKV